MIIYNLVLQLFLYNLEYLLSRNYAIVILGKIEIKD
jgi:hypothetical protein